MRIWNVVSENRRKSVIGYTNSNYGNDIKDHDMFAYQANFEGGCNKSHHLPLM